MATAELSADELALYDRQLRVWGAEGQNKIKNASVLLINFNGVGTEIVKNLTLSGIGSLELWDSSTVTEDDLSAQFFLSEDDVGKNKLESVQPRIKDMNPRVNLTINTSPIAFSIEDTSYFEKFKLVIANNLSAKQLHTLNAITRKLSITLHITAEHGLFGYFYNDLLINISTYTEKKQPIPRTPGKLSDNSEILTVTSKFDKEKGEVYETYSLKTSFKPFEEAVKSENLKSLKLKFRKRISPILSITFALYELELEDAEITEESLKARANQIQERLGLNPVVEESYFSDILQQLNTEIAPVAAILGGAVAQDVINQLSGKDKPINNFMVLDGDKFMMPIYEL
ncbi:DNA damage tolerance protein RHC31 [Cyberlindnera fabianii]|uniref:DNA damage tolerance protein RHC31 n=1 Tax=Cyberlindnera fabianii TaxID=36022 RepID=A0A1V2L0M4_CYBFA|nr:DNA damage tolerance protein RHC31 [Cyberlindnera fabianii]